MVFLHNLLHQLVCPIYFILKKLGTTFFLHLNQTLKLDHFSFIFILSIFQLDLQSLR